MLKSLLKIGDLNSPVINQGPDSEEVSFIVFDILSKNLEEVFAIVLVQCGADTNTVQYSFDPINKSFESILHRAIKLNFLNMVKLLVDKGANVNTPYIYMRDEKEEIELEIQALKAKLKSKDNKENSDALQAQTEDD